MRTGYTYCINEDNSCIHRRGCRRWLGNYTEKEVKELYTENRFVEEIDESKCIPNYSDANNTNSFKFLDRFRLSNGEDFK